MDGGVSIAPNTYQSTTRDLLEYTNYRIIIFGETTTRGVTNQETVFSTPRLDYDVDDRRWREYDDDDDEK